MVFVLGALIVCLTGICIVQGQPILDAFTGYKQKKLEEEHKTTNLALVYQILNARPELSLEEVVALIDQKGEDVKRLH